MKVHCAYTEMVARTKLRPHPKNPNKHPDQQIAMLAKIIESTGWRHPIVVSKLSNFIVFGHGRLAAAEMLGEKEVPVDYQDFASEEDEKTCLLADNKIAELADMDNNLLKELLIELDTAQIDMDLTGFDLGEIEKLIVAPTYQQKREEEESDGEDTAGESSEAAEPSEQLVNGSPEPPKEEPKVREVICPHCGGEIFL